MASSIHISPREAVIVVGPRIVSLCRRPSAAGPTQPSPSSKQATTHREAYKEAWRLAGETGMEDMYATAYECDPRTAFERVLLKLKEKDLFTKWRESVFETSDNDLYVPGSLFSLVSMVERGARLATTTLPPVLSKCLRMRWSSLHSAVEVEEWIRQQSPPSLLHLGGSCTHEHGWMDPLLPPANVSQALGHCLAKKTILLMGFEEEQLDYSLLAFLSSLTALQGPLAPSVVMLTQKGQLQFPLPVPVFILKMCSTTIDSECLKDGSDVLSALDSTHGPAEPSLFRILYQEEVGHNHEGAGSNQRQQRVADHLQKCWSIMLPGATIEKMADPVPGLSCVGVGVPGNLLHTLWDSLVNKRSVRRGENFLAVRVGSGPVVSISGTLSGIKAQSSSPAAQAPAPKLPSLSLVNGRANSMERTTALVGRDLAAVRGSGSSSSGGFSVAKETTGAADLGYPRPQLTPTTVLSPGLGHFWRTLPHNGQLVLMPSPAPHTPTQPLLAHHHPHADLGLRLQRPQAAPLRRSSAIDKEDDGSLEIDGPSSGVALPPAHATHQQLTGAALERVMGPFVAEPSVPVEEGLGSIREIKLVHKWMERRERGRLSQQGSSTEQGSFEEDCTPPPSSSSTLKQSPLSSPPPPLASRSSPSQPSTANTSPRPAHFANVFTACATPTTATFPMSIHGNPPFVSPSQAPLLYTQGMPGGTVLVANPYQAWNPTMVPSYVLPPPGSQVLAAPVPGAPLMTSAGMPSRLHHQHQTQTQTQTTRLVRDHHPQSTTASVRTPTGSPLRCKTAVEPEAPTTSGLKRVARLSSSLPDISQAAHAKKPKLEGAGAGGMVGVSTGGGGRVVGGGGGGSDRGHMVHSSSVPEETARHQRLLSFQQHQQPRKQMSEDTELAEITGGPLYMYPFAHEGGKLPPFPIGRGVVQLWQFLLDLLLSQDNCSMIYWTGDLYEFRIVQPDEIARLWGRQKNKPQMNYDKLSRGLRYYYAKGIMDKVPGKKLTFRFTCDVEEYVQSRSKHPNAVEMLRNLIKKSSSYSQQC